jgi:hypothetical protein
MDPKPTIGVSPYATFNGNPIFNSDPLGDSTGYPIMPRHPIKSVSDIGYAPYNVIGFLVNGGQSLLNKAGDYLNSASNGDPLGPLNNDLGGAKDAVSQEINYYRTTPNAQILANTKSFFSNPDNYFQAAEQAFVIVAAGKLSIPNEPPPTPKISVAEEFTLKSGGRLGSPATQSQIYDIGTELESRGYTVTRGGGRFSEEYLKPLGGGRKGGSYLDLTATHPNYPTLRINTVDIYKSGLPTLRELKNAARIRKQIAPGEHLLLINKR